MATKADQPLALRAWCPYCERLPGAPCVSHTGRDRNYPHAPRAVRARSLVAGRLRGPIRPGEVPPPSPQPDAIQLSLVGYSDATPTGRSEGA